METSDNSERPQELPRLLTPGEARDALHVSATALLKWAKAGKIRSVVLPNDRRRYYADEIRAIVRGDFDA